PVDDRWATVGRSVQPNGRDESFRRSDERRVCGGADRRECTMTFETSEQTTLNEPERVCADALAELFLGETGRPDGAHRDCGQRGESPAEDCGGRADPAPAAPTPATARRVLQEGLTDDAVAVEVVLAGHLPVMASAWVSQYARGLAAPGQP